MTVKHKAQSSYLHTNLRSLEFKCKIYLLEPKHFMMKTVNFVVFVQYWQWVSIVQMLDYTQNRGLALSVSYWMVLFKIRKDIVSFLLCNITFLLHYIYSCCYIFATEIILFITWCLLLPPWYIYNELFFTCFNKLAVLNFALKCLIFLFAFVIMW